MSDQHVLLMSQSPPQQPPSNQHPPVKSMTLFLEAGPLPTI